MKNWGFGNVKHWEEREKELHDAQVKADKALQLVNEVCEKLHKLVDEFEEDVCKKAREMRDDS